MSNIYEVARLAGVSLSTVSRVLNGKKSVNPAFREKVEKAMAELNYRPSNVARSLANKRTDSVGLLIAELNTPFFGEMMKAVEYTLRAANKHVIITVGHHELQTEEEGIDFLISRQCDALILHSEAIPDQQLLDLNENKLPISVVNRVIPGLEEACIYLDNEAGGYLSAKHLLDLGHTQIGYIAGPNEREDARLRLKGYIRAMEEAGFKSKELAIYQGDYTEKSGITGIEALFETNASLTAISCANDWMASGAMTWAREQNISLPDELSIIGFDNILFSHHLHPKLTTILNPIDDMGEMAANYILNKVYKQKKQVTNVFQPQLIKRQSTLPLKL